MVVGFVDDFLKIKLKKNEGLKPYQKIIFQSAIAIVAGIFVALNGLTRFNIPFIAESVDIGVWAIPIVAIIFMAVTNCVNLTDGLDGLAGGVSAVYLFVLTVLICLQTNGVNRYIEEEYKNLNLLSTSLVGGILGFLVYNVSKAKVFMGDTGSLSLGGFIGAISIFSSNSFFIPVIGIMFVMSGISVIVQVLYYKKTKKRVLLMAPLHHHFQLKGYSESKISFCYAMITLLCGVFSLIGYMGG
jgi:phospho-N-acetylmuramoyl-pentapeptide-transferase